MAAMKVYSLGNHGFVDVATGDALGLASHIRQARVLVAATSKVHAVRVLAERGFPNHPVRDPEFRLAMGNDVDALNTVGLLVEPTVIVLPMMWRGSSNVVVMQRGGVPLLVGRIEGGRGIPAALIAEGSRP